MASTNPEEPELKAGHAPAVKVGGGVRITQNKNQENEQKTKEELEEEKKLQKQAAVVAANERRMLIAGAPTKGDKDFTTEAVKSFHEKPEPTVQPPHVPQQHHLFQPRKQ